jgi:hydrogenase maturation protease
LLGLGNELLADDALGILVAREVRRRLGPEADVVESSESGFRLLDAIEGATRLLVVDTVTAGGVEPGTIYTFLPDRVPRGAPAVPHGLGLFETLALGRLLGLAVPETVAMVLVEATDCTTVGGAMDPRVRQSIPQIADWAAQFLSASGDCVWETTHARSGW